MDGAESIVCRYGEGVQNVPKAVLQIQYAEGRF